MLGKESLIAGNSFNPTDQMRIYLKWYGEGYWSGNGIMFSQIPSNIVNPRKYGARDMLANPSKLAFGPFITVNLDL